MRSEQGNPTASARCAVNGAPLEVCCPRTKGTLERDGRDRLGWSRQPPGNHRRCSRRTHSWSCFCRGTAQSGPERRRTFPGWPASAPRTWGRDGVGVGAQVLGRIPPRVRVWPVSIWDQGPAGPAPSTSRAQPPFHLLRPWPSFPEGVRQNPGLQMIHERRALF